jgi:hypothetical protein
MGPVWPTTMTLRAGGGAGARWATSGAAVVTGVSLGASRRFRRFLTALLSPRGGFGVSGRW